MGLHDRARQFTMSFFSRLSRIQRADLAVAVTTCLGVLFVYSWTHSGPPEYFLSGKRITTWTSLLGAALLYSAVRLFVQLRGKK